MIGQRSTEEDLDRFWDSIVSGEPMSPTPVDQIQIAVVRLHKLGDLEQALMRSWHLPELLAHIVDDKKANDPQVRSVTLAVRLARHTAQSWENPAVPDDLIEIGALMNLSPAHTLKLVHEVDGVL